MLSLLISSKLFKDIAAVIDPKNNFDYLRENSK